MYDKIMLFEQLVQIELAPGNRQDSRQGHQPISESSGRYEKW